MTLRAATACRRPGCRGLVRGGVCSVCGPVRSVRAAETDARRGSANERGYGRRWRRLRAAVLASEPLCAECARRGVVTMATDVHHIVAKRDGGADTLENLEPLCHACHSRITASGG